MFKVVRGSLKLPGRSGFAGLRLNLLAPGAEVPEGVLSAGEIERLETLGVIARVEPEGAAPESLPPRKGRLCHDPASLAGRTVEQLRVMLRETDPEYAGCDLLGLEEADLVRILTSDFDPIFAAPAAPESRDRHRPADLRRARAAARGE